jgi:primosomal protein N' (replication factor Y)
VKGALLQKKHRKFSPETAIISPASQCEYTAHMPADPTILQVALPVPLRRLFDYLPPEGMSGDELAKLEPGVRLKVPFGHQQKTGLLVATAKHSELPASKLKPALEILDKSALLPPELVSLVSWGARYYQYPVGDALLSALPVRLRQGAPAERKSEPCWQLTTHGQGLTVDSLRRAPKQAALWALLAERPHSHKELLAQGFSASHMKALHDKGLAEKYWQATPQTADESPPEPALALNDEQQMAVDAINSANGFDVLLLEGVTGSGKTEVYLHAIHHVLAQGKQALVLVPEIGLTPQTVNRFRKRFACPVAVLHSGLNDGERLEQWLTARSGEAGIVIGTRSALFTPLPEPGLIIIDEEHDNSFKQQDNFRYSARDLAIVRARNADIPIILGSATPSLETLHNAIEGRYRHLRLTQRAGDAKPPRLVLVDSAGKDSAEGLGPEILDAVGTTLEAGNQVLVFLNRRGYSPVLICADCSWMATCQHCDARLTAHRRQQQLRCHHCGFQARQPVQCPSCKGHRLDYLGQGTQRSEEDLQQRFPRFPVIRIDRDSMQGKNALEQTLAEIQQGQPAILLGTQMLAKGHHFPDVTLVVVLDADGGIFSADFRGAEYMAQLLTQVGGRAGRAEKPGSVMIQSRFCEHPILQTLATESYDKLARQLLRERQLCDLPPYVQQAVLRCESRDVASGVNFLQQARTLTEKLLTGHKGIQMIGPVPSLMEKRAAWYRNELIFSTGKRNELQQVLAQLALQLEAGKDNKKIRWAMDVDPV